MSLEYLWRSASSSQHHAFDISPKLWHKFCSSFRPWLLSHAPKQVGFPTEAMFLCRNGFPFQSVSGSYTERWGERRRGNPWNRNNNDVLPPRDLYILHELHWHVHCLRIQNVMCAVCVRECCVNKFYYNIILTLLCLLLLLNTVVPQLKDTLWRGRASIAFK